jgi:hypothetical protein
LNEPNNITEEEAKKYSLTILELNLRKTNTPNSMAKLSDDGTIVNPVVHEKNLWEKSTWFYKNMKKE